VRGRERRQGRGEQGESVGRSVGVRTQGARPDSHRAEPEAQPEEMGEREEPSEHGGPSILQVAEQPPRDRILHEPLPMPCEQHRRIARKLGREPRVAEQDDQVGVGSGVRERVP
jgi:hypothetical protein